MHNDRSAMHHLNILLVVGSAFLFSCGSSTQPGASNAAMPGVQRTEVVETITAGEPMTLADLEITGMSCAMMCGGSIKKALASLDGVLDTRIEFNEGDEADHAVVAYDPARVNDGKLVDAVQSLYDGQYKVVAVRITKQVKQAGAAGDQPEEVTTRRDGQVSVSISGLVLPGLYMLLSQVLRS